jgi:site-specific recombinase XerD
MRYPADPRTIEEIVTVMRRAGDGVHGRRLRGLIVGLWRAGLRICEALALAEADLDARRGSLLVRRGNGARRREVGMDDWAWEQLAPWLDVHQLRHAHAVEMAREGVPLIVIQRQLGHTNLGITSIYLQGIDNAEISTRAAAAPPPGARSARGLPSPHPDPAVLEVGTHRQPVVAQLDVVRQEAT